ncbi:MAG: amidase [Sphingomonadaceae bacterium]
MSNYDECDALDLAALIHRGEASPDEVLKEAWTRTQALNPALNAVVWADVNLAQQQIKASLRSGPFCGVPFLVKDIFASVAGLRSSAGSVLMKDVVMTEDSELVRRHRSAGFVFFGMTTTPELAMSPTTEAQVYDGPTRNPWSLDHSSGGSSGGSAAAVAAGIIPLAHASDGGGSIRIPASACGVFGFKPTRGRNPVGPAAGELLAGLGVEHAVSRSVRDSAALLDWTEGADVGAPYAAPPKDGSYLGATMSPPPQLCIALLRSPPGGAALHPDCEQALGEASALCEAVGHNVEPAEIPEYDSEALFEAHNLLLKVAARSFVTAQERVLGRPLGAGDIEAFTREAAELGAPLSAVDYAAAVACFHAFGRHIAQFMARYDVLLTPSLTTPPVRIGELGSASGFMQFRRRVADYVGFLTIANYCGLPAMSVPLHWNEQGLPIGSHFIGRSGAESTLFALAAQLEQAKPWFNNRPALITRGD